MFSPVQSCAGFFLSPVDKQVYLVYYNCVNTVDTVKRKECFYENL